MNMKKWLSLALATLCLTGLLCACGSNPDVSSEDKTPSVSNEESSALTSSDLVSDKVTYKVKVVDEQDAPVAGALVQLCMDTCFPSMTGADGVATFVLDENDYTVKFAAMPEGYTCDEAEFFFEEDSTELTIVLTAAE